MSLPTAATPGYGTITRGGRTFVGCDCIIAFLLAGERLGLAKGLIKKELDIVQLTGDAAASGNVHRLGAAFDVLQFTAPWVIIWREMGSSFWPRLDPNPTKAGDLWDNNEHGHGGITCPHDDLIAYQMVAYKRGYSGLGKASSGTYAGQWGYGSLDPNRYRPKVYRTWREGIAWADAQVAAINAAKEKDDMPTLQEISALIDDKFEKARLKDASDRVLGGIPSGSAWGRKDPKGSPTRVLDTADGDYLRRMLVSIGDKIGIDTVDETALAAAVVEGLKPTISASVVTALSNAPVGATPEQVAEAVVGQLGAALAPKP
jgi:hypothetical protein